MPIFLSLISSQMIKNLYFSKHQMFFMKKIYKNLKEKLCFIFLV
ncbi:hypothetical protein pah_c205o023 [Parachlamydia acanthamoebae str. Hall's coccus]|nr:hypothetical protein pah_c205o023 [Parachlamydia acanthamoebae str. Hall's coccus]